MYVIPRTAKPLCTFYTCILINHLGNKGLLTTYDLSFEVTQNSEFYVR